MVAGIIGTAIIFIIDWIVISVVIMLAGKLVAGMEATFKQALLASLVAAIVGTFVYYGIEWFFPSLGWLSGSSFSFYIWRLSDITSRPDVSAHY